MTTGHNLRAKSHGKRQAEEETVIPEMEVVTTTRRRATTTRRRTTTTRRRISTTVATPAMATLVPITSLDSLGASTTVSESPSFTTSIDTNIGPSSTVHIQKAIHHGNHSPKDQLHSNFIGTVVTCIVLLLFLFLWILFSFPSILRWFESGAFREGWVIRRKKEKANTKSMGFYEEKSLSEDPAETIVGYEEKEKTIRKSPIPITAVPRRRAAFRYFWCHFFARPMIKIPFIGEMDFDQFLVCVIYFTIIGILTIVYTGHDWVGNNTGPAFIAASQIPVAFMFAAKNSLVSVFIGKGYEKLNILHRLAGRTIVVLSIVHTGLFFKRYWADGIDIRDRAFVSGSICTGALCVLFLTSFQRIRAKFYQTFLYAHIFGWILFVIAINVHGAKLRPYTWVTLSFWFSDYIVRALKSRISPANLVSLSTQPAGSYLKSQQSSTSLAPSYRTNLSPQRSIDDVSTKNLHPGQISHFESVERNGETMTLVEVTGIDRGWRAGQHVWIRLLSDGDPVKSSFGWRWIENHPFTIASASAEHSPLKNPSLKLMIKGTGKWTTMLHSACTTNNSHHLVDDYYRPLSKAKVIIDGPYGGSGYNVYSTFQSVVLVVGGSGVSFGLSLLEELVGKAVKGDSSTRLVVLAWVVRSIEDISWCSEVLAELLEIASTKTYLEVRINIYVTKPSKDASNLVNPVSGSRLYLTRPDVPGLLDEVLTDTVHVAYNQRLDIAGAVGVGVCGPVGLVKCVQLACAGLDKDKFIKAGGVVCHPETFGW